MLVDAGEPAMADKVVAAVNQLARDVDGVADGRETVRGLWLCRRQLSGPARNDRLARAAQADSVHREHQCRCGSRGRQRQGRAGWHDLRRRSGLGAFAFVKESAMVYAHENVLARMTAAKIPTAGLPTESYQTDLKQYFNGEGVQLIHTPAAHSDGDSLVWFRGSDVISTGDVFSTETTRSSTCVKAAASTASSTA